MMNITLNVVLRSWRWVAHIRPLILEVASFDFLLSENEMGFCVPSVNPSGTGKFPPILPVNWVVISAVGQKKCLECVSKTGKPPSFSAFLISFHGVDSVRK